MRRLAAIALFGGLVGCAFDPSDFAAFLGDGFGDATATVMDLDEAGLERVMDVAVGRFRAYSDLRDAVPFAAVGGGDCAVEQESGEAVVIVTDMSCAVGGQGAVTLLQEQVATTPVPVFRFSLGYEDVLSGALSVAGTEILVETVDSDGATVHTLDVVQDGVRWNYSFRSGLIGGETPIFDYVVTTSGGDLTVRLTNPTAPGVFATVLLTGIDGALRCDLRDTDWSLPPRGVCDNGIAFGLP
jgi:hypothetical protein